MSHDQCPTTRPSAPHPEKHQPTREQLAMTPRRLSSVNGQAVWRSPDELFDNAQFREHLEREFPAGMAELVTRERQDLSRDAELLQRDPSAATGKNFENRREFLKLMGASMALAGVAATVPGCRRPDHKIYTYSKNVPEEIIPGKALYYVTAMPRFDGGCEGLLVETHDGRPTKIEGNPLHPGNQGKSTIWSLASIMGLYDPDRAKFPMFKNPQRGSIMASWDDFRTWGAEHFKAFDATQGEGLAFLVEKSSSPTRAAMRDRLMKKWPNATWTAISSSEASAESAGTLAAFGTPMRCVTNFAKAHTKTIVSFDRDFLQYHATELASARQFAATRQVVSTSDEMSRLYAFESTLTATGAAADHRMRLAPSRVTAALVLLAKELAPRIGGSAGALKSAIDAVQVAGGEDIDQLIINECATELIAAGQGQTAILVGASQPAAAHALAAVLNDALGNIGKSVQYLAMEAEEAGPSTARLALLTEQIKNGSVKTLICIGVNPLYDAPGDLDFTTHFAKVPTTITWHVGASETAAASTWSLNGTSYLEAWGDAKTVDGTLSPIQPMIAPLYEPALSEIEFLALLSGKDMSAKVDGYELVRETWRTNAKEWLGGVTDFETKWRRALHDGLVASAPATSASLAKDMKDVAAGLGALSLGAAPTSSSLEVAFTLGNIGDGRFANIGWLQELPAFGTRVVWDNPVLLSPKTAVALGLAPLGFKYDGASDLSNSFATDKLNAMYTEETYPTARVAELSLNGKSVKAPVWILPGMADNTAVLMLGYGRTNAGLVGDGVGVNFSPLRKSSTNVLADRGATLRATGDTTMVVSTQNHWTMDGKDSIVRAVDLPAWKKHGDVAQEIVDSFYGTKWTINFAERLGELSHTPPNISIYDNPYNRGPMDADPTKKKANDPRLPSNVRDPSLPAVIANREQGAPFSSRPQWGMTIDQTLCTGCGACTIACQAENNIAVVGKKETAKGREMAWIRVDRYFTGDDLNNPGACMHQPVACVHCENAPCEVVCPVNATIHGPEGLNYMTYNRCIGTRYCANNCPYKVRRYNWFDYGVTKFNGGYYFKEAVEAVAPDRGGITGSGEHNKINPNLIPPRLRDKLDEITKMSKNPDVTVRSRGVMEKCTYCVQRINAAKIECKLAGLKDKDGHYIVPEGFFQAACQQACPSNAIVFGDILDEKSKVHATRRHARSYALLGYLNTRPRTSHMVRVMNPNPRILQARDPARFAKLEEPFHHGAHHGESHEHLPGAEDGTHEPGESGGAPKAHSFFDTRKKREDRGYAMSLRVLSTSKPTMQHGGQA